MRLATRATATMSGQSLLRSGPQAVADALSHIGTCKTSLLFSERENVAQEYTDATPGPAERR